MNEERALTTEAPTPCNPPDVVQFLFVNFPPEWRVVILISKADLFLNLGSAHF